MTGEVGCAQVIHKAQIAGLKTKGSLGGSGEALDSPLILLKISVVNNLGKSSAFQTAIAFKINDFRWISRGLPDAVALLSDAVLIGEGFHVGRIVLGPVSVDRFEHLGAAFVRAAGSWPIAWRPGNSSAPIVVPYSAARISSLLVRLADMWTSVWNAGLAGGQANRQAIRHRMARNFPCL